MNKFLKRLSVYILSLTAIFLINGFINFLLYTNTFCEIKESNVLITGDSHLKNALDPQSFNDAINISQPGESLPLTYWKVKKILETYTPDTLIIGFAPHNLGTYQDYKFSDEPWASEMLSRSYPIQDFKSLKIIDIEYLKYIKVLWRETGFYPKLNHCNYIGSFATVSTTDLSDSDIERSIQIHYYYNGSEVGVSSTALYYLNKLIDISHARDINLILASSPVHPKYYNGIPSNIVKTYNSVLDQAKSKGITVIDQTNKFYPDSLYRNAHHLNQHGANRFTDEVTKILAGL